VRCNCAVIEAERAIKRKLALNKAGEDSDPEANEEHEDADGTLAWGASREAYYDAEDVDVDVSFSIAILSRLCALCNPAIL
jgi:hypothetical protein